MTADLIKDFEPEIASIQLIPSDGGKFEVMVNSKLIYSKLETGRHAEPGEVNSLVDQFMKKGYKTA